MIIGSCEQTIKDIVPGRMVPSDEQMKSDISEGRSRVKVAANETFSTDSLGDKIKNYNDCSTPIL